MPDRRCGNSVRQSMHKLHPLAKPNAHRRDATFPQDRECAAGDAISEAVQMLEVPPAAWVIQLSPATCGVNPCCLSRLKASLYQVPEG